MAGTVGAMMALLMGRDARALARACDLGVAMQLSNIARDVGEDARMGRLYLPLAWMREAGLDPDAWLAHRSSIPPRQRRLAPACRCRRLYPRVDAASRLPRDCRPASTPRAWSTPRSATRSSLGLDSVHRARCVGSGRKLALLMRACGAVLRSPGHPIAAGAASEPLPAVRFLVEAAATSELPARTFYQRTRRVIDLFERQGRAAGGGHRVSHLPVIVIGVALVFGGVLAFGWPQLRIWC